MSELYSRALSAIRTVERSVVNRRRLHARVKHNPDFFIGV